MGGCYFSSWEDFQNENLLLIFVKTHLIKRRMWLAEALAQSKQRNGATFFFLKLKTQH